KADRLRRAMATFKRVGTIDRFRAEFIAGMVARGYPPDFAARCFGQIEGFGEYGFPESHAASFAILVTRMAKLAAWLSGNPYSPKPSIWPKQRAAKSGG